MKVLLTGAAGQLGRELSLECPPSVEFTGLARNALDITDRRAVLAAFEKYRPQLVINAAAYTNVDQAELDRDAAFAVNSTGAGNVAAAAAAVGSRLLHLSTDFVFDGAQSRPLRPDDPPRPISVYGHSKRDGEEAVQSLCPRTALIVRSSWIYSRFGSNFVNTMLVLMKERPRLDVVSDQVGTPTWARTLAGALWGLAARPHVTGIRHWADAGVASWYDFAVATQTIALELGLLESAIPIEPISTEAYPTPAARPRFSVLDTTETRKELATQQLHWGKALRLMLEDLANSGDA